MATNKTQRSFLELAFIPTIAIAGIQLALILTILAVGWTIENHEHLRAALAGRFWIVFTIGMTVNALVWWLCFAGRHLAPIWGTEQVVYVTLASFLGWILSVIALFQTFGAFTTLDAYQQVSLVVMVGAAPAGILVYMAHVTPMSSPKVPFPPDLPRR